MPDFAQRTHVYGHWLLAWLWIGMYAGLALGLAMLATIALDPAFAAGMPAAEIGGVRLRNSIPVALLALVLLALTRRPALSLWLTVLALFALQAVNALKLEQLETPLLPIDFVVVGDNFGGGLLLHYLPQAPRHLLAYSLCALIALGLCLEAPLRFLRDRQRFALLGLCAVLVASLIAGIKPVRLLYPRDLLNFQSWSPTHTMEHAGLIAGLLRYGWEFRASAPAIDMQAAHELVQFIPRGAAAEAIDRSIWPDIVVVQSESFFDPARLNGIEVADTIPHFRRLASRAIQGDLWVPAFGGGTIRTEFEFLTGLGMRYFPQDDYPYFRLTATPLASLPRTLAAHGYRTLAIHPNAPSFWNRGPALAALGFDRFDSESAFDPEHRDGFFISDAALTAAILERLHDDGPPQFVFAISMEAHGPYENRPVVDPARRDRLRIPDGTPPPIDERLRNLLYHLDNADRSLGDLADALMQRPRRTLLLFYGDHLPAMPRSYRHLGFRDGAAAALQPAVWLLLDSADATATRSDSASFFLPGQLLAAAGIGLDPYFRLTEVIRRETRIEPGFTPAGDNGLAAIVRLRQRGTDRDLYSAAPDPITPGLPLPVAKDSTHAETAE